MRNHISIVTLTLALTLGTAIQSRAQGVTWSTIASGCVLQTAGENVANNLAPQGIVTFTTGMSGDIKLTCPISFLSNSRSYFPYVTIGFYNDHGFDGGVNHCFIQADLLRGNLTLERGGDIASLGTYNHSYSGRSNVTAFLTENMDFQSNFYWMDIWLHRDSPYATCNPAIVGAYLGTY